MYEPSSWSVVLGAPSVWLGDDDSAFAMEGGRGIWINVRMTRQPGG